MSIKLSRKPFEDIVKSYVIVAPEASMPSPGVQGRVFISSDTLKIFIDTGTQWVLVGELRGLSLASHGSRHAYSAEDPLPPNSISNDQIVSVDWDKVVNKPSTYPPSPHTHSRSNVTDFWSAPFWDNIPDKPNTYPPSSHTHSRGDITDFWAQPFWDNIPDKPSTYSPSPHTHDASDIVSGTLSLDRIPTITTDKIADGAITRAKLETPSTDVHLGWYVTIGTARLVYSEGARYYATLCLPYTFADKAIKGVAPVGYDDDGRNNYYYARITDSNNSYHVRLPAYATTADHKLLKIVAGAVTTLGSEAVDLSDRALYSYMLSASGSAIKSFRTDLITPKISVTDTSLASGYFGVKPYMEGQGSGAEPAGLHELFVTTSPASPAPKALAVAEVGIEGNGRDAPYAPSLSRNLVEISLLTGLPDFLYQEARRYEVLRAKGFTDEEIKLVFGYVPQHQVDLDAVTWGAFEFHPDKASTVIITITGDNPYKPNAIERQKAGAKRVFNVPRNYNEAVALYNQLKKDYPHWLAGKDNFAYQVLGWEELDWFQNVDFYYGEFIDHKTHYDQLKRVPDWEIRNRLSELLDKLSRVSVLTDERDGHLAKLREILKKGW